MQWQQPKKESGPDSEEGETPFNLDNLRSSMAQLIGARRHLLEDPLSRQKLVEESAVEDARERLEHEFQRLEAQGLANLSLTKKKSIRKWMWEWYSALTPRLERDIKTIITNEEKARGVYLTSTVFDSVHDANFFLREDKLMAGKRLNISDRVSLGPFLTLLKPHQLALLTIMEVLRLHGTGGVSEGMKTARALITVGMAVEQEYNAAMRKREMSRRHNLEKFYRTSSHSPSSSSAQDETTLRPHPEMRGGLESINARREAAKRDAEVEAAPGPEWSRAIQARIGGILVDALMDTATVMRTIPHPETGEP